MVVMVVVVMVMEVVVVEAVVVASTQELKRKLSRTDRDKRAKKGDKEMRLL